MPQAASPPTTAPACSSGPTGTFSTTGTRSTTRSSSPLACRDQARPCSSWPCSASPPQQAGYHARWNGQDMSWDFGAHGRLFYGYLRPSTTTCAIKGRSSFILAGTN